ASNIHCGKWQGTGSRKATSLQSSFVPHTSQATNIELTPIRQSGGGLAVMQTSDGASYLAGTKYLVGRGTVVNNVDYTLGQCHYSGSSTLPVSKYATLMLINNFSLGGSSHRRYTGYDLTSYDVTLTCPDGTSTF